jgi:tetratricopeptide (TPR) repeat protein
METLYQRFLQALADVLRYRPGIVELETERGHSQNYLRKVVRGINQPNLRGFLGEAEAAGVGDPFEWLWSRIAYRFDVVGKLGDLPHPAATPRLLADIHRAAKRIAFATPAKSLTASSGDSFASIEALSPGRQARALKGHPRRRQAEFLAAAVDWLDLYRYEWPTRAASLSRAIALELCPNIDNGLDVFLRALGVYASAVRMRGSMTLAAMVLHEILPLAYRTSRWREADLIQRASYVLRDHARHADSLQASTAAGTIYAGLNDRPGQAKTITDRGICFYLRGDAEVAIGEFRNALAWLPETAKRHRFAAHLTLGAALAALCELARLGRKMTRAKFQRAQQVVRKARRVGTPRAVQL